MEYLNNISLMCLVEHQCAADMQNHVFNGDLQQVYCGCSSLHSMFEVIP